MCENFEAKNFVIYEVEVSARELARFVRFAWRIYHPCDVVCALLYTRGSYTYRESLFILDIL